MEEKYNLQETRLIIKNVKTIMKDNNVAVADFYEKMFISRSTYYNIMSGRRELPVDRVVMFAEALEVEVDALIDGVDAISNIDKNIELEDFNKLKKAMFKQLSLFPRHVIEYEAKDISNGLIEVLINVES